MKTIQNVDKITIKVSDNELIGGKWLNYQLYQRNWVRLKRAITWGIKACVTSFITLQHALNIIQLK